MRKFVCFGEYRQGVTTIEQILFEYSRTFLHESRRIYSVHPRNCFHQSDLLVTKVGGTHLVTQGKKRKRKSHEKREKK